MRITKKIERFEKIIEKDLRLSDRIYRCECGNIINRDFQAAINLKAYGEYMNL